MKKIITFLGVAFLIGAFAMPAMAHGPGYGKGPGPGGGPGSGWNRGPKANWGGGPGYCWGEGRTSGALTEEQASKMDNLSRKFYDETAQTRESLWSKMGELNRLFNSENPDAEKAKALQKEISDLRSKMAQARIDFELEQRKIAPEGSYGRGFGPGMRGHGPGMRGYGPGSGRHMMGEYGPGSGYYGHHMGGYGPGWHHRGGYGPEACWR